MATKEVVPMYGSRYHYIGEDGIIYDSRLQEEVINPWLKRITLNTVIETPYMPDQPPTLFTYGQRLAWSFYGKTEIPFELRRDTDVITIDDIKFVPTFDKMDKDHVILNGEYFKLYGVSNGSRERAPFMFYLNEHGHAIQLILQNCTLEPKSVRWKYVTGYAVPTCRDFQDRRIHVMVNELYNRPLKDDEICHHLDECHWDNSAKNLDITDRSEHIRHHSHNRYMSNERQKAARPISQLVRHEIELACQMLQDDVPMADIAYAINPDPTVRGVLIHVIGDILNGKKYADISKDYNFSGYHRNRGPIRESDAEAIEKACQMLSDTKPHSELEIRRETGLSVKTINRLRKGEVGYNPTLHRIWEKYDINPNPYAISAFAKVLTNEQVQKVRRFCEKSNLDDGEIGKVIGCSAEVVRKIRNGDSKAYGKLFNFAPAKCEYTLKERKYKKEVKFLDAELAKEYDEFTSKREAQE